MNVILTATLIGTLVVTSYQSKPCQTDSTPFRTSINERVNSSGIAVHPSLLCPVAKKMTGKNTFKICKRELVGCKKEALHYFDFVFIEDVGFKTVNDVMAVNTKMNSRFDVWVASQDEEKKFHERFGKRQLKIWRVEGSYVKGEKR